jgi:predicted TIM-barrel fold metal-dependent hydrolase
MTTSVTGIIDAHHHIWRQADQAWLSGPMVPRIFGPYEAIRRDYPIAEYLADATPAGVVQSVYVQTNWPPGQEAVEVDWVDSVAEQHGFPHAIVAFADLAAPDLGRLLDRYARCGRVRGIRQQLHWHRNEQYRFQSRPDLMNDPAWRHGMAELAGRGLSFDLQVFAGQMADAAQLARDFPGVTFILQHAGMLEDLSEAGWAAWRTGMDGLAGCPNVVAKLSGLGTFLHRCDAVAWKPVIQETVRRFGAGRCMFGSNFPIEKLWTRYADIVAAVDAALRELDAAGRRAIFHDTAARVYRL